MPRRSSTLLSAKMFRTSSSTTSTAFPTRSSSDRWSRSSIRCFSGGRSENTRWRNSDVSSSSRSGDSTPLTTTLRASVWSWASSSADSSRPVNTTTGMSARLWFWLMRSSTSKPDMSGRRRSSTTQSQGCSAIAASAAAPVSATTTSRSSCPSSSVMLNCSAALSSTTSRRLRRGSAYDLIFSIAASRPSVVVGLVTNEKAPRASPCCRSSSSVTIWTGICRVSGFCFS